MQNQNQMQNQIWPNIQDKTGWTRLMSASCAGKPEYLQELLQAGANVNLKDNSGFTALIYALGWSTNMKYIKCIILLLQNGAICNTKTNNGWDTLSIAKYTGDKKILKILKKTIIVLFIVNYSSSSLQ